MYKTRKGYCAWRYGLRNSCGYRDVAKTLQGSFKNNSYALEINNIITIFIHNSWWM